MTDTPAEQKTQSSPTPSVLIRDPHRLRYVIAVFLCLLGLLALFNTDLAGKIIGFEALRAHGETLVGESLDRNIRIFAGVSAIKAGLALVEGSSVGVGFDLQLGDLIQPAYDYVDFVWRVFMFALVVLLAYKILLEIGILALGIKLAAVGLLLLSAHFFSRQPLPLVRRWARAMIAYGLLFTFILPAALVLSDHIAANYSAPLRADLQTRMSSVQIQFRQAEMDALDLRSHISVTEPGQSLERLGHGVRNLAARMGLLARDGLTAFLHYILLTLFDLLLLPFATALVLWFLVRLIANPSQSRQPDKTS